MKSVKLHRTDSQTWRILLDGNVHPLLVGFHKLFDAVDRMIKLEVELGPYDIDSLRALVVDLDGCLKKAWVHTDIADENVTDVGNTRALMHYYTQRCILKQGLPTQEILSRKHNPTDEQIIEVIMKRNAESPNLRLGGPYTAMITYAIVMDDKEGKETWLIGAAYGLKEAEAYLERIKKMFEEAKASKKE